MKAGASRLREKKKRRTRKKKEEGIREEKRWKAKVWNFVWKLILRSMETLVRMLVWKFCWKILVSVGLGKP